MKGLVAMRGAGGAASVDMKKRLTGRLGDDAEWSRATELGLGMFLIFLAFLGHPNLGTTRMILTSSATHR